MTRMLGIETSCDDTGVAVVDDGCKVVVSNIASQIEIHATFGGVVPEIASRRHTEVISQLAAQTLDEVGGDVDAIAATAGPGLMGSLLVGLNFGKALAFSRELPFVPVQHLEGHIFSAFLGDEQPTFPFLALLVSGGHTCLVWCKEPHHYSLLGTTRDDAVGESFDKVARLLDLPYPGGPSIQDFAKDGDPSAFDFPRPMTKSNNLDFSYSGLKTAVLYTVQGGGGRREDLAASFQAAAIDILLIKTKIALKKTGAKRLVVAGGVAANALLRQRVQEELAVPVFVPPLAYCVDNGAMIAAAAHSLLEHGRVGTWRSTANPGLPLAT